MIFRRGKARSEPVTSERTVARAATWAAGVALVAVVVSMADQPDPFGRSSSDSMAAFFATAVGGLSLLWAVRERAALLAARGHVAWMIMATLATLIWAGLWSWDGADLPDMLANAVALGPPLIGLALWGMWLRYDDARRTPWQSIGGGSRYSGAEALRSVSAPLTAGVLLTILAGVLASVTGQTGGIPGVLPSESDVFELAFLMAAGIAGLRITFTLLDRPRVRADVQMAAHLHDSVLQQLAVIRRSADDPAAVRAIARATERDLRDWLAGRNVRSARMLTDALRAVTRTVEDENPGAVIEFVTAGDLWATDRIAPAVDATREALRNAVRHGGGSARLFAEVAENGALAIYVRDTGPGFDPAAVPAERRGVRDAIIGRMQAAGGSATIDGGPEGTEVTLRLPAVDGS